MGAIALGRSGRSCLRSCLPVLLAAITLGSACGSSGGQSEYETMPALLDAFSSSGVECDPYVKSDTERTLDGLSVAMSKSSVVARKSPCGW